MEKKAKSSCCGDSDGKRGGLVVVLSGPSCAGKTPLLRAVERLYPDLPFARPIPYTSRRPRPGELDGRDFRFMTQDAIRALPAERFLIGKVRAIWQAVDLREVASLLENNRRVVFELYYELAVRLLNHPAASERLAGFRIRTVFVAPVTDEEVEELQRHNPGKTQRELLAHLSRLRQTIRALRQGKPLSEEEKADIEARAATVWDEMLAGKSFTDYLVNHDGEDSPNWDFTPPLGDAGKLVRDFAKILMDGDCGAQGRRSPKIKNGKEE